MTGLIDQPLNLLTAGVGLFADAAVAQGAEVHQVDWRPPMAGTEADLATVLGDPRRQPANAEALRRITSTRAMLVDVLPAGPVLGLSEGEFLHAGPPIGWDRASGPLRGALLGAAVLEGLVETPEQAEALFETGKGYRLDPCHHHGAVGPMAGVISSSMWLFVVEDPDTGRRSYCSLNEGL
ncbi:MAG: DUF1116 domain-containing protein, partial [Jatrophihabitantaceae bacterium]